MISLNYLRLEGWKEVKYSEEIEEIEELGQRLEKAVRESFKEFDRAKRRTIIGSRYIILD